MRRPRFERTSVDSATLSVSQRTESIAFSAFRSGPAPVRRGDSAPPLRPPSAPGRQIMSAQKRECSGRKGCGSRPGDKKCRMAFDMISAARISRSSVAPRSRPGRTGASGRRAQKIAAGPDQQRQHDVATAAANGATLRITRMRTADKCGSTRRAGTTGRAPASCLAGSTDSNFKFLAGRLRRFKDPSAASRRTRGRAREPECPFDAGHSGEGVEAEQAIAARVAETELESTRSCQPSVVSCTSDRSPRDRRDG